MSHNVESPKPPPPHRPRHQHSRSQQLTSTQPSLTSRRHQQHHSISIGSGSPRGFLDHFLHQPSPPQGPVSPLPTSNTSIDIEFDGDSQVIIRPNRIVKGKLSSCICMFSPNMTLIRLHRQSSFTCCRPTTLDTHPYQGMLYH